MARICELLLDLCLELVRARLAAEQPEPKWERPEVDAGLDSPCSARYSA